MAEIAWLGHACFRIRGRDVVIITDPVGPASGYDIGHPNADIVTVSHDHPGHNALDVLAPGYRAFTGPGEYETKDVFITGIRTFHDTEQGRRLGKNTIFLIEIEGLVICHLGDLGHLLTEEQSEGMSEVDVLIVPAGGPPTIPVQVAAEVIGQVEPRVVIPMQYRTEQGDREREPLERFLKELGGAHVEPVNQLNVKKSDLGDTMQVVVLNPRTKA